MSPTAATKERLTVLCEPSQTATYKLFLYCFLPLAQSDCFIPVITQNPQDMIKNVTLQTIFFDVLAIFGCWIELARYERQELGVMY